MPKKTKKGPDLITDDEELDVVEEQEEARRVEEERRAKYEADDRLHERPGIGLGGGLLGRPLDGPELEDDGPRIDDTTPEERLHRNIQDVKGVLLTVRDDLAKLRAKYRPEDRLDDLEDFGSYYNSMKKLFDQLVIASKTTDPNSDEAFILEHRKNELMMKSGVLTNKVILLEESKPEKQRNQELLDHFRMRKTDEPTTRKTLNTWLNEQVVDIANPEQTKQDLIKALQCYINIRNTEKNRWYKGFNKQEKLDAAQAMVDFLSGAKDVSLTTKQLEALTSDDLGKIIAKFQSAVPDVNFNERTHEWDLQAKTHAAPAPTPAHVSSVPPLQPESPGNRMR